MTSKHLDRRQVLAAAAAGLATSMGGTISKSMAQEPGDGSYNTFAPSGVTLGPKESFSFDLLAERAKANAGSPWEPTPVVASEILERIDYDAFQKIRYRTEMSLMLNHGRTLPVQLFHLGKFSRDPVKIHLVEGDETQEVLYNSALFNAPEGHPARDLPQGIGFAGFRVMDANLKTDWLAFLGASYFRSSGPFNQYGISARGLAINTGATTPEEFPRFTDFWLDSTEEDTVVVYAYLDSESVTGAYRMTARRTLGSDNVYRVVQDIEARLFARHDIGRLGVAPFSSMYWYGATNRRQVVDWRPEIHDSDGVAVWTGAGERIWRPLNNPPRVMVNAFIDRDVRGFGLLQRDRDFVHYLDDSVFYERRPSTWVEPLAPFGQGAVHLLEIPTDDEIHDNIAAYWCPDGLFAAGESRTYSYRLSWLDSIPFPDTLAKTTGTWTGIGGRPGHKRPEGVRKFVVDFQGAILNDLGRNDGVEMIVTPARGILSNAYCHPVVDQQGRWRALFDLDVSGSDPVDIRMFLRKGARALTETWVFQYFPEST